MRRVKPTTTKARVRQAMPPSRKARGVEPPAWAATPPVLSCMAMAGDSTEMLMATASQVRNDPRASWALSGTTLGASPARSPSLAICPPWLWSLGCAVSAVLVVPGREVGPSGASLGHRPATCASLLFGRLLELVLEGRYELGREVLLGLDLPPGEEGLGALHAHGLPHPVEQQLSQVDVVPDPQAHQEVHVPRDDHDVLGLRQLPDGPGDGSQVLAGHGRHGQVDHDRVTEGGPVHLHRVAADDPVTLQA